MARFRVNCEGCAFDVIYDDEDPPEDAEEGWNAERAAIEKRDDHQLSEGHSVEIVRVE